MKTRINVYTVATLAQKYPYPDMTWNCEDDERIEDKAAKMAKIFDLSPKFAKVEVIDREGFFPTITLNRPEE